MKREIPRNPAHSPKSVKKKKPHPIRIPEAQQQRIVLRAASGESVTDISRAEKRSYKTISNVILKNSDKLRDHLEKSRADFLAMIPVGLATIKKGMEDGQTDLAYKFLTDAGVVGSTIVRAHENAGVAAADTEHLSGSDQMLISFVKMAKQRAQDYDLPDDALELRPPKVALTVVEKTS